MRWDENLEGPARRIAEVNHSPLRVLAGPGTGKTFALMRRVARLLQDGGSPRRILVCTFTRTAASDLKKELCGLGVDGVDTVRAGTLHAFSFGLLSKAEVLSLLGRVPRPLLQFEERFLLEDLQDGSFGGIRERERRLQAFNAAWARLQTDQPGWPTDPTDRLFHQQLLGWLRFQEAMLIGELIPETLRYLRENPVSEDRRAFDHVLVDEYQDLNRAEQILLDILAEAGTLTVIGDEDQSIYSFKHAHPEGIATFAETYPTAHDESLLDCRRCPSLVVEMANRLIGHNPNRAPRLLQPLNGNPRGDVYIVQWRSIQEEAEGIARFIKVVQVVKRKKMPSGKMEEKVAEETIGGILHWGRESSPDLDWFREEIRKAYGGRAPKVLDPFAGGGAMSRSGASCPCCPAIMTMEDIRLEGQGGRLGAVMTAIVVDVPNSKEYVSPTDLDRRTASVAETEVSRCLVDLERL